MGLSSVFAYWSEKETITNEKERRQKNMEGEREEKTIETVFTS